MNGSVQFRGNLWSSTDFSILSDWLGGRPDGAELRVRAVLLMHPLRFTLEDNPAEVELWAGTFAAFLLAKRVRRVLRTLGLL